MCVWIDCCRRFIRHWKTLEPWKGQVSLGHCVWTHGVAPCKAHNWRWHLSGDWLSLGRRLKGERSSEHGFQGCGRLWVTVVRSVVKQARESRHAWWRECPNAKAMSRYQMIPPRWHVCNRHIRRKTGYYLMNLISLWENETASGVGKENAVPQQNEHIECLQTVLTKE